MFASFILPGLIVGTSSASSPGPMMALLIQETLKKGLRAGLFVAITPIITDGPLVILALIFAQSIRLLPSVLGTISLAGGCFLIFLGISSIKGAATFNDQKTSTPLTLGKAIVVNLLNPYPYILWFSVATPIFARGSLIGGIAFAVALLGSVAVTMSVFAIAISMIRERFLPVIPIVTRVMGCALIFFAILLIQRAVLYFVSY